MLLTLSKLGDNIRHICQINEHPGCKYLLFFYLLNETSWYFISELSHLHQIVVLEADSQVQGGQEGPVEDVGVSSKVQQSPAALRLVLLHSAVEGNITLIVTAVYPWGRQRIRSKHLPNVGDKQYRKCCSVRWCEM